MNPHVVGGGNEPVLKKENPCTSQLSMPVGLLMSYMWKSLFETSRKVVLQGFIHVGSMHFFFFFSHFVLHMWNTDVMAWGCSIDFVPVRERSRLLQRLDHLGAHVSTCRHSLLHFSLCSKKMRLRVFEALGMGLL